MSATSGGSQSDPLRQDAWNRALEAYGTAYIYEQRLKRCRDRLKWLTFLAVAVPAIVGALALSYGVGWSALPIIIIVGSALGVLQLGISVWALVAGWQESSEFLAVSVAENHSIAGRLQSLAKNGPQGNPADFATEVQIVMAADDARRQQDNRRFSLSEKESRKGMRAGLRQYRRACAGCNNTPTSMNSTSCDVCGNF